MGIDLFVNRENDENKKNQIEYDLSKKTKTSLLIFNCFVLTITGFFFFAFDVYSSDRELLRRGISILIYSMVSINFAKVYYRGHLRVWTITLVFTVIGILARYFLLSEMMIYAPRYVGSVAISYIIANSLLVIFIYSILCNYKNSKQGKK